MQSTRNAFIALISGIVVIGSSAVLIKSAHAPGIVTAFYRMSIGAIGLLIPFSIYRFRNIERIHKKGIVFAVIGGIFFGTDMSFWATGIVASNATIPTIAANMAPIWTGLGAVIIFKEKIKIGFWIGVFVALLGVLIMLFRDVKLTDGLLIGFIDGTIAGCFYGMYYLATQKGRALLSTIDFLFISTLTSAIFLLIVMFIFQYPFTGYDHHTNVIFISYGIGVQILGWWLINYAQGHLRAVVVAPTLLVQPLITAIIAFVFLNETHSVFQLIGGAVIILGIYIVHFTRIHISSK